jgi:hypothetical protein
MRLVVSLMCLGLLTATGVARAQTPPAPAPTQPAPEAQTAPPPPPPSEGPVETASERAVRYSRFSSGSGGMLLVFTELLSGLTTGAILGHTFESENGAYVGGVLGALSLGTAAAVYQYYVPVERNESLLAAGGAALGFLAGFGYGTEHGLGNRDRGITALLTTQVGIIGVLAATAGPGDVSDGDASLVGMTALYAFVFTGLIQSTVALGREGAEDTDLSPTLIAPALGMALGGALAIPFELSASRVFKLTALPLGVGAALLLAGTALANGPAVPLSAMGGIAATFVITLLATAEPPTPYPPSEPRRGLRSEGFKAAPVPVLMRSGARGESLTAGPGLLLRF